MIKNVIFGSKEIKMEATLGTAEIYQRFTGDNFLMQVANLRELDTDGVTTEQISSMPEFIKRMAFIMNISATAEGDTPLIKIRNIKSQLDDDNYLAWQMQFDVGDFTPQAMLEVIKLYTEQAATAVESKN